MVSHILPSGIKSQGSGMYVYKCTANILYVTKDDLCDSWVSVYKRHGMKVDLQNVAPAVLRRFLKQTKRCLPSNQTLLSYYLFWSLLKFCVNVCFKLDSVGRKMLLESNYPFQLNNLRRSKERRGSTVHVELSFCDCLLLTGAGAEPSHPQTLT